MKKLLSIMLTMALIILVFPANIIASAADINVTLYSRNPVKGLITGEGCLDTAVTITDGKAPACPANFTFDGWTFWGWSAASDSAVATYQPGDTIPENTTELYASWVKRTGKAMGSTSNGGVIVDKYLSYYSGGPMSYLINQPNTVAVVDYNTPPSTVEYVTYEIIFPVEYDVVKYADPANNSLPVTLVRGIIDTAITEPKNEDPDELRERLIAAMTDGTKTSYTGVTNLFRMDEDGYLYYDSPNTHAQYDEQTNSFILYDNVLVRSMQPLHLRTGFLSPFNVYDEGCFANGTFVSQVCEQYYYNGKHYPMNEMKPFYYRSTTAANGKDNQGNEFLFGITGESDFLQRPDGKMPNGEDCIYQFSGDDEMYVYIDDILVLDAGNWNYGYDTISSINFATGDVVNAPMNDNSVSQTIRTETTLYDIYRNAGKTDEELADIFIEYETGKYRFKDFSKHSFEFYYADIGETISRMMTKFSLLFVNDTTDLSIKAQTTGNMGSYADASYKVEVTIDGTKYTGDYTIGNSTFTATDGYLTLKAGETAVIPSIEKGAAYTVTEIELPLGFNEPVYTNKQGNVADDGTEVTITNSLATPPEIEEASDVITVEKVVDGQPETAETFKFTLTADDAAYPMPDSNTVTVNGAGRASFGEITFDEAGTYVYKVSEVDTDAENYTYDEAVYTVTYNVVLNNQNALVADKTITKGTSEVTAITFTNVYNAPEANDPPVEEPPVEEPPVVNPPTEDEPPVVSPPADEEPPVEEPPVTTPAVTTPSVVRPPYTGTRPAVTEPVATTTTTTTVTEEKPVVTTTTAAATTTTVPEAEDEPEIDEEPETDDELVDDGNPVTGYSGNIAALLAVMTASAACITATTLNKKSRK